MSYTTQDVLIPAGQALSNAIDCTGYTILRIIMPTPWDPAPISFRLSPDGVNYHDLFHTTPQTFTSYEAIVPMVPPGAAVNMPVGAGTGIGFVKIRSGSRAAPVVQSADRTFTFVLDPLPVGIPAGPAGPQGLPGNTGPTGPAGPQGASGAVGAVGPVGSPGPTGGQGPIGPTGSAGLQGAQGIQGSPGVQGPLGPTGPTGTFNLKGVTDGSDAPAGQIGEYISATVLVGAAKAANTGVNVDITSITLPAGDWDVQGQVWIGATGTREVMAATNVTGLAAWVSKVSATLPTVPAGSLQSFFGINIALTANLPVLTSGRVRFSLSAPTTIYLSGIVTFTGTGPLGLYGFVGARRMR